MPHPVELVAASDGRLEEVEAAHRGELFAARAEADAARDAASRIFAALEHAQAKGRPAKP